LRLLVTKGRAPTALLVMVLRLLLLLLLSLLLLLLLCGCFVVAASVESRVQQAMCRSAEFSWQDLSSLVVALRHGRHPRTTIRLATQLVICATDIGHTLSTQVVLNIAMSAIRHGHLGGDHWHLRRIMPFACQTTLARSQTSTHGCSNIGFPCR
jgi:hypothetical protein